MKYPEDFINKVIQGDCLEVMKEIPDKSIDLVVTDPPYGIGIGVSVGGVNHSGMVKVGGKNLSIPKVTGDSMIPESPKKKFLMKCLELVKIR